MDGMNVPKLCQSSIWSREFLRAFCFVWVHCQPLKDLILGASVKIVVMDQQCARPSQLPKISLLHCGI